MTPDTTAPADCRDMREVRAGIDRLDRQIVTMIAERFRYMDAAARIKGERSTVRDEARKAEVIANVRRLAEERHVPAEAVAQLYEGLIEASIAYELAKFDALHETPNAAAGG